MVLLLGRTYILRIVKDHINHLPRTEPAAIVALVAGGDHNANVLKLFEASAA
jgi:hypothetical protein